MAIALYIHIPFCARKCAYCDFASYANRLDELPGYLCALEREMAACDRHEVSSVFIGGGTPSLMSGAQLARLMDAVRAQFALTEGAEITLEANPGMLDGAKLGAYRTAGVNRLSLGAQAMQPELLKLLGRIHTWADVEHAVRMARGAGFGNINLDLMYALPGQRMGDWIDTLKAALTLAPEHISAYSLILEPGTALAGRVERGELETPDDDLSVEMQRAATRLIGAAGYGRYEVSNYAKPGFECRHNIVYWMRGDYLGLGAAAHSLMDGARFSNTEELDYHQVEWRLLTEEEIREERIMLGTRMTRGVELSGLDEGKVERLCALGLAERHGDRLRLTERGLELQNAAVLSLI